MHKSNIIAKTISNIVPNGVPSAWLTMSVVLIKSVILCIITSLIFILIALYSFSVINPNLYTIQQSQYNGQDKSGQWSVKEN